MPSTIARAAMNRKTWVDTAFPIYRVYRSYTELRGSRKNRKTFLISTGSQGPHRKKHRQLQRVLAKFLWLRKYRNAVVQVRFEPAVHEDLLASVPDNAPDVPSLMPPFKPDWFPCPVCSSRMRLPILRIRFWRKASTLLSSWAMNGAP